MTKEEALKILRKDSLSGLMNYYSSEELQDAIDTIVSQPSLPSNLDEAAKESAERWRKNPDGSESRELFFQPHIRGFKAGVKWLAGQGYSKEARVWVLGKNETPAVGVDDVIYLPKDLFERGDKVIVQIRKIQQP